MSTPQSEQDERFAAKLAALDHGEWVEWQHWERTVGLDGSFDIVTLRRIVSAYDEVFGPSTRE